jgi:uncharacterized protein (DUF1800 family)
MRTTELNSIPVKFLFALFLTTVSSITVEAATPNRLGTIKLKAGKARTIVGKVTSSVKKIKGLNGAELSSFNLLEAKTLGRRKVTIRHTIVICKAKCTPLLPSSLTTVVKRNSVVSVTGPKLQSNVLYGSRIFVADGTGPVATPTATPTPVLNGASPLTPTPTPTPRGGSNNGGNNPPVGVATPTPTPPSNATPTPTPTPVVSNPPVTSYIKPKDITDSARFLHQATFGPTDEEIVAMQSTEFNKWFEDQARAERCLIKSHFKPTAGGDYYMSQFINGWWNCAISGEDQLRQRMTFALSQIFVVSSNMSGLEIETFAIADYYEMLSKNAFGNFRELLEDVSLHPAMGEYLSHKGNKKEDPSRNLYPDENYAREIMQLFTIGLVELNLDGSVKLDNRGLPIQTYNNDIIRGFAKVFTGWNFNQGTRQVVNGRRLTAYETPMVLNESDHSPGTKLLTGGKIIPAGQGGRVDLAIALDNLFNHPNVGPFIARRLIQRLVTSNPSGDYIRRVATVFNNNGKGVRGDLLATLKAIFIDPESRELDRRGLESFGRMREPLVTLVHLLRLAKVTVPVKNDPFIYGLGDPISLSQEPMHAPSVFNYFEPDYVYGGTLAEAGLFAPEFQITNHSSILARQNSLMGWFLSPDLGGRLDHFYPYYRKSGKSLVEHLNLLLTGNQLSENVKNKITEAINLELERKTAESRSDRDPVATAIRLILASPDYIIQQ